MMRWKNPVRLFDPKGEEATEEIIFYPFSDSKSHDGEPAIPEIQRPLQLAIGKYRLVVKCSSFTHFPMMKR